MVPDRQVIELDVALPNGLVFLMDVESGQGPDWSESPVFSSGSCIAVRARHEQAGNVRIVLERVSAQGGDPCTFEAVLDAPRGALNLVNVHNEALTEVKVGRDRVRAKVWIDDLLAAASIRIVVADS